MITFTLSSHLVIGHPLRDRHTVVEVWDDGVLIATIYGGRNGKATVKLITKHRLHERVERDEELTTVEITIAKDRP